MGMTGLIKTQEAGFGHSVFQLFSEPSLLSSAAAIILTIGMLVFIIFMVAVVVYWAYMTVGKRGGQPANEVGGQKRRITARERAQERWGVEPYLRDVSKII